MTRLALRRRDGGDGVECVVDGTTLVGESCRALAGGAISGVGNCLGNR